jgi:D-alanine-D-alanine ligase-like ATP-grasp enzyme
MKLRVGVIFGGRSGEHEIAIRSARTVIEQIDKNKYEVVPIAISQDGRWLSPAKPLLCFRIKDELRSDRTRHTTKLNRLRLLATPRAAD